MHNTFSPLLVTSIFELHTQTQTIILPVSNTVSHIQRETETEFSIWVLWKIFGPKRNQVTGE
jgi:hypothetical protein